MRTTILIFICTVRTIAARSYLPGYWPKYNITRNLGGAPDQFHLNDVSCSKEVLKRFCAEVGNATQVADCHCQCEENTPIFNQYLKLCQATFASECEHAVNFYSRVLTFYQSHSIYLPLASRPVNENAKLDWQSAGVTPDKAGFVDCRLGQMALLTESGWVPYESAMPFELGNRTSTRTTVLLWHGFDDGTSADFLSGKQVKLTMKCPSKAPVADRCITFAVVGIDTSYEPLDFTLRKGKIVAADGDKDLKTSELIAIISAVLLVLSLVGVLMLWAVCWRYQKDRLARRIAAQLIQQQRQAQSVYSVPHSPHVVGGLERMPLPAVSAAYQTNMYSQDMQQASNHAYRPSMTSDDIQHSIFDNPHSSYATAPPGGRKRLFFSPQFFEPEYMQHPPDVATEFLYEVRRMIDIAKSRIRQNKHTPTLPYIEEEDEEAEMPRPDNADSPEASSGKSASSPRSTEDSGFASNTEDDKTECKVKHWLEKLPDELDITETATVAQVKCGSKEHLSAHNLLLKYLQRAPSKKARAETSKPEEGANGARMCVF